MTAPRHLRAAFWKQAADIRDEWLRLGLACGPADRSVARVAITKVYASMGRPQPEFVWVRSPREAQPLVRDLPTLDDLYAWVSAPPPEADPPLASDLATVVARLRWRMDDRIDTPAFDPKPPKRKKGEPWPEHSVDRALDFGVPFVEILRRHVREELFRQLIRAYAAPAKRSLGEPSPVCWFGQQESHWIAYYDVWRQLGLADFGPALDAELDVWADVARSAGWFWPGEHVCVVAEKPVRPGVYADGFTVPA
ncbi:MAG: hypothetical protein HOV76_06710 [Hamadaea sp.]|nr:hypothetical protein [Hamadaea sp.]